MLFDHRKMPWNDGVVEWRLCDFLVCFILDRPRVLWEKMIWVDLINGMPCK